jgi:hypothetical protein
MQPASQSRPPVGLERLGAEPTPGVPRVAVHRTQEERLVKAQHAPLALDDIYLLAPLTPPESDRGLKCTSVLTPPEPDRGQDAPMSPLDCNVHCPQALFATPRAITQHSCALSRNGRVPWTKGGVHSLAQCVHPGAATRSQCEFEGG